MVLLLDTASTSMTCFSVKSCSITLKVPFKLIQRLASHLHFDQCFGLPELVTGRVVLIPMIVITESLEPPCTAQGGYFSAPEAGFALCRRRKRFKGLIWHLTAHLVSHYSPNSHNLLYPLWISDIDFYIHINTLKHHFLLISEIQSQYPERSFEIRNPNSRHTMHLDFDLIGCLLEG